MMITAVYVVQLLTSQKAVSVGWNTYEQMTMPCVEYGTSKTSLTSKACGTGNSSVTYHTSRTWSNAVTISNLTADTTYHCKSLVQCSGKLPRSC